MGALRVVSRWLFDLAVVVVAIACIAHVSRRSSIACAWHGMRASCSLEAEDVFGGVQRRTIEGIHGAAYRDGAYVGLVTDARHKDETAFFGTSEIRAPSEADAQRLYAFVDDHSPDRYTVESGAAHPRLMTALLFVGVFLYGFFSGRLRRRRAATVAHV